MLERQAADYSAQPLHRLGYSMAHILPGQVPAGSCIFITPEGAAYLDRPAGHVARRHLIYHDRREGQPIRATANPYRAGCVIFELHDGRSSPYRYRRVGEAVAAHGLPAGPQVCRGAGLHFERMHGMMINGQALKGAGRQNMLRLAHNWSASTSLNASAKELKGAP